MLIICSALKHKPKMTEKCHLLYLCLSNRKQPVIHYHFASEYFIYWKLQFVYVDSIHGQSTFKRELGEQSILAYTVRPPSFLPVDWPWFRLYAYLLTQLFGDAGTGLMVKIVINSFSAQFYLWQISRVSFVLANWYFIQEPTSSCGTSKLSWQSHMFSTIVRSVGAAKTRQVTCHHHTYCNRLHWKLCDLFICYQWNFCQN